MMNMKRVCCIFNYGPHYDFPLYKEMDIHLSCNFYIGDHLQYSIKNFDYSQLSGYRGTLHNIFFRKFYWQKGSPKACNKLAMYNKQFNETGQCSVGQVMAAINWNNLIDLNKVHNFLEEVLMINDQFRLQF